MRQNLKKLAATERSLFAKGLEERYNYQCLQATVKHGAGTLHVWGCVSANRVEDLVRINGVLDAEKYQQILTHHAIPSGRCMIGHKFILQQENDPKHNTKVIKNHFQHRESKDVLEVLA